VPPYVVATLTNYSDFTPVPFSQLGSERTTMPTSEQNVQLAASGIDNTTLTVRVSP
jgi:hypothetical protein